MLSRIFTHYKERNSLIIAKTCSLFVTSDTTLTRPSAYMIVNPKSDNSATATNNPLSKATRDPAVRSPFPSCPSMPQLPLQFFFFYSDTLPQVRFCREDRAVFSPSALSDRGGCDQNQSNTSPLSPHTRTQFYCAEKKKMKKRHGGIEPAESNGSRIAGAPWSPRKWR